MQTHQKMQGICQNMLTHPYTPQCLDRSMSPTVNYTQVLVNHTSDSSDFLKR